MAFRARRVDFQTVQIVKSHCTILYIAVDLPENTLEIDIAFFHKMIKVTQFLVMPLRMMLTAYCFVQFAIQVLWLGKWSMPRLLKNNEGPNLKRQNALYDAHRHVTFYLKTLSALQLIKFKTIGAPLETPCIVVANHPSLLDFIVFLRDYPNAICMYKPQSLDNPVLSSFVLRVGSSSSQ